MADEKKKFDEKDWTGEKIIQFAKNAIYGLCYYPSKQEECVSVAIQECLIVLKEVKEKSCNLSTKIMRDRCRWAALAYIYEDLHQEQPSKMPDQLKSDAKIDYEEQIFPLEKEEQLNELKKLMLKVLNNKERLVIYLWQNGWKTTPLGKLIHCNGQNVSKIMNLAINKLRKHLEQPLKGFNYERFWEEHREEAKEYARIWTKNNEEHVKEYRKEYYRKKGNKRNYNPEKAHAYYQKNKEHIKKRNKEYWRSRHPIKPKKIKQLPKKKVHNKEYRRVKYLLNREREIAYSREYQKRKKQEWK